MEAINAAVKWFVENWSTIEALARNIAADLAAVWALGLALSKVLKPLFPTFGAKAERKILSVLEYDEPAQD